MAEENEDGQEKTEEPSQRKLDKAADDGKVLTSKEMFVFTSVGMGLAMLLASAQLIPQILDVWGGLFVFDTATDIRSFGLGKLKHGFYLVILTTLVAGIPLLLVSLATQAAVGGINFGIQGQPDQFASRTQADVLDEGIGGAWQGDSQGCVVVWPWCVGDLCASAGHCISDQQHAWHGA